MKKVVLIFCALVSVIFFQSCSGDDSSFISDRHVQFEFNGQNYVFEDDDISFGYLSDVKLFVLQAGAINGGGCTIYFDIYGKITYMSVGTPQGVWRNFKYDRESYLDFSVDIDTVAHHVSGNFSGNLYVDQENFNSVSIEINGDFNADYAESTIGQEDSHDVCYAKKNGQDWYSAPLDLVLGSGVYLYAAANPGPETHFAYYGSDEYLIIVKRGTGVLADGTYTFVPSSLIAVKLYKWNATESEYQEIPTTGSFTITDTGSFPNLPSVPTYEGTFDFTGQETGGTTVHFAEGKFKAFGY